MSAEEGDISDGGDEELGLDIENCFTEEVAFWLNY